MSAHESWTEEKQSAFLYRALAQFESGTTHQKLFVELARAAEEQAVAWEKQLEREGSSPPPEWKPGFRVRLVARLLPVFGPRQLRTVMAALKVRGMSIYTYPTVAGHALPHGRGEHRHSAVSGGGNLRAAVFGINDGLISNASLILGVAGAEAESGVILLSGCAGMLAGAFSMAAGEWVSVRSQRELYEHQIHLEQEELELYPEEEAEELALIFEARGLEPGQASKLAHDLIGDPDKALDTLAREELGLNPDELGSPWGAAISSFLAFAAGAFLPLSAFLFAGAASRLSVCVGITAGALFTVGAVLSFFTGRSAWWSGLRMLAIGAGAGALTFGLGRMLGVSLG